MAPAIGQAPQQLLALGGKQRADARFVRTKRRQLWRQAIATI